MNAFRLKPMSRALLLAGLTLAAQGALAGADIYSSDTTKLTFNFDAVAAGFQNKDSWFGVSKAYLGENTDDWSEFGAEPRFTLESKAGPGTIYGQLSGVYTATFSDDASGLTINNGDSDDAQLEQGHLGYRIDGVVDGLTDSSFSLSAGRQDFKIGSGLLFADGGSDGGENGGWYIGMRKAFKRTVLAQLTSKELKLEGFYLENRPRRGGPEGEVYGANVEYTFAGTTTLGLTYASGEAKSTALEDLDVWDGRIDVKPTGALEGLFLSGEFAHEEGDGFGIDQEADAWFAEAGYEFKKACWTPALSYRYAHFDGDDPSTPEDEQFRELAYGFSDYGSWFQGEITGNYPLANGNLDSHRFRVKVQPNEKLTLNLMYYDFTLDQEQVWGAPVSSDDWGQEYNFTADWAATDHIYVIGVLGVLQPGDAAEQYTAVGNQPGGDDDWLYSMLYVSYAF